MNQTNQTSLAGHPLTLSASSWGSPSQSHHHFYIGDFIFLLDVMWSRFWFRRGIRRIGRWRFFGWLVKGRRKPHQAWSMWSTLSWKIVRYWPWKNFGWATGHNLTWGPTRFLREGLRGAYAKVRTEHGFLKTWHCNFLKIAFVSLISLSSSYMNHTIQFACKIILTHQEKTRVRGQKQTI